MSPTTDILRQGHAASDDRPDGVARPDLYWFIAWGEPGCFAHQVAANWFEPQKLDVPHKAHATMLVDGGS